MPEKKTYEKSITTCFFFLARGPAYTARTPCTSSLLLLLLLLTVNTRRKNDRVQIQAAVVVQKYQVQTLIFSIGCRDTSVPCHDERSRLLPQAGHGNETCGTDNPSVVIAPTSLGLHTAVHGGNTAMNTSSTYSPEGTRQHSL